MVRSLVIRQAFRLFDIILTLAVIAVVLVVIRMFLAPLGDPYVDSFDTYDVELASVLKTVGNRRSYDGLVKGGLFGNASDWDPGAAVIEEPPDEEEESGEIEETDLGLALRGTVALESGKDFAAALIENVEKREKAKPFKINEDVLENIVLVDIAQREVILLNKRQDPHRKERLTMEIHKNLNAGGPSTQSTSETVAQDDSEERERFAGGPPFSRGGRRGRGRDSEPANASSVQHMTLNHNEIITEVMENFSSLASITPEVKMDESGQILGLTADNIESQPLAQKLGFRNGDVLQSVNNEEITSRVQLYDIFQRYQSATSFRVGILRDGRPMIMNFQID